MRTSLLETTRLSSPHTLHEGKLPRARPRGESVGSRVLSSFGTGVGSGVGAKVGMGVATGVGAKVGMGIAAMVGSKVGMRAATGVGAKVGDIVGTGLKNIGKWSGGNLLKSVPASRPGTDPSPLFWAPLSLRI